ncbi:MAG: alkanesulfonate monooxygenase, partial [Chloroflexota bacterium]
MINVRSGHLTGAEVAWFAPICGGDFEYLGVEEEHRRSTFELNRDVLTTADHHGFRNILLPSSYQYG